MGKLSCEIIRDLVPAYKGGHCSKETEQAVKEHLEGCEQCRDFCEHYQPPRDKKAQKAVLFQAVLLFLSFALIALGTILEMHTAETDANNGVWACCMVVPAAALLLSTANWYIIALYKSKKKFCLVGFIASLVLVVIAFIAALIRYKAPVFRAENLIPLGIAVVVCVLARLFSGIYARLLKKE